jgi:hypothetical protein
MRQHDLHVVDVVDVVMRAARAAAARAAEATATATHVAANTTKNLPTFVVYHVPSPVVVASRFQ